MLVQVDGGPVYDAGVSGAVAGIDTTGGALSNVPLRLVWLVPSADVLIGFSLATAVLPVPSGTIFGPVPVDNLSRIFAKAASGTLTMNYFGTR